jgi:hypothetical protein
MPITPVTHLLIHTVSLYRLSEASVGRGRWRDDTELLAADIKGRVYTASGSEREVAMERKTYNGPVAYLEADQDVAPEDYLVKDDVWYRVLAVLPPSLAYFQKLLMERVQLAEE